MSVQAAAPAPARPLAPPPPSSSLELLPITLREANAFVVAHHRHHGAVRGCVCVVGVSRGAEVVGVAIVGRPVARRLQDGYTAEVTRVCVLPGERNACSKLYGAAWRAARALGYRRLVTYTLSSEPGVSLRGAGWRCLGEAGGGTWSRRERPRLDLHPLQVKLRWEVGAE